jgi:hypothetical protein
MNESDKESVCERKWTMKMSRVKSEGIREREREWESEREKIGNFFLLRFHSHSRFLCFSLSLAYRVLHRIDWSIPDIKAMGDSRENVRRPCIWSKVMLLLFSLMVVDEKEKKKKSADEEKLNIFSFSSSVTLLFRHSRYTTVDSSRKNNCLPRHSELHTIQWQIDLRHDH